MLTLSNHSAGGGGNTKERKGKIEEKNQKLDEERIRRRQEEEKAKITKRAEGVKKDLIDESAIHPSRRGRVPVMK
jgi:nucleolar protein 6